LLRQGASESPSRRGFEAPRPRRATARCGARLGCSPSCGGWPDRPSYANLLHVPGNRGIARAGCGRRRQRQRPGSSRFPNTTSADENPSCSASRKCTGSWRATAGDSASPSPPMAMAT
jgi:hypothetical protein